MPKILSSIYSILLEEFITIPLILKLLYRILYLFNIVIYISNYIKVCPYL